MRIKFIIKILCMVFSSLILSCNAFAMNFTQPVKIGEIGFPVQAPYHGFIIKGESYNTGTPFFENIIYHGHGLDNSKEPIKTYVYGIARYGGGDDALYCSYDFNSKDFAHSIKFGGKDDYIIDLDGGYKEIFKINSSNDLSFYVIYHYYCVTKLNIVGRQKNGKWVSYIDSQDVSKRYFNGKDDYKEDGGVIYDEPICYNDSVIITYRRWHWGETSEPEGEIRLKWDDKVQWFGIDCKKY